MSKLLNVGVLGAAKIAKTHIIPAMGRVEGLQCWGVASRSLSKAQAYIQSLDGISAAHTMQALEGYEALINHPDVDIIYNPLPNDLHVELSLKALAAGKHVLCEKPLALNAVDAKRLVDASRQKPALKVMEAFMYRFHPQWQQVQRWISDGEVGVIQSIASQFCYCNTDPANIRNNPAAGGGALMDIGSYGISVARMILAREPSKVVASAVMHPEFAVDDIAHCLMDFDGVSATVMVGTKTQRNQSVTIEGSKGRIVMTHPFYCDKDDERTISLITDNEEQTFTFGSRVDHYQLMLEVFVQAINTNAEAPITLSDSLANMAVIDAAFDSIKTGAWVTVG
ncbi:Gfo/Idh/MocA family protein [Marinagarivorans algicola]|uniref:Gfo/Idh/MocA family protein n=1 Tax=Marinagarivorans algicola TaxID=1513270 RepID=UPI0006B92359|nr:Gfo/Idh/MocA family oxidoreductase [Marinagarivorans algicola]